VLRIIAFIVLMTAGTVAAVVSRFAALLVYVWFALFRPQEWVWFDISRFHLSLALGLLLVVPSLLSGIFPNLSHPLSIGFLCFIGTALLGQIDAVRPAIGWEWLNYLGRLTVVSLLAVTLLSTRRRFILMVAVIAGSLGVHAAKAGVATVLGGGVRFGAGLAGAFIDNNGYALAVVMILPLLVASAQNIASEVPAGRWARWGFLLAVPSCILTVISTFSRAGFLALVAATAVFVALQRRRITIAIALGVAALVVLLLVPVPEGYFQRVQTIGTYQEIQEDSALSRLHFWRVALDMVSDHPLGIGLRNFEATYDRYDSLDGRYGRERSVHSSHLQALAETGYAGFVVWIALFAIAFRAVFKIRSRSRAAGLSPGDQAFLMTMSNALAASMTGFLVGGAFIALLLNDLTWLTFALVAALDRLSARMVSESTVEAPSPAVPISLSSVRR
jgi:putative inorganic carbon (hco3(-)) transporter